MRKKATKKYVRRKIVPVEDPNCSYFSFAHLASNKSEYQRIDELKRLFGDIPRSPYWVVYRLDDNGEFEVDDTRGIFF